MHCCRLILPRCNVHAYRIEALLAKENSEPGSSRYTYAMLLILVKLPPPPPTEHELPYLCDQHFSRSTLACLYHGTDVHMTVT